MGKLRDAFLAGGLDEEYVRGLAHDREREESLRGEALTAIISSHD